MNRKKREKIEMAFKQYVFLSALLFLRCGGLCSEEERGVFTLWILKMNLLKGILKIQLFFHLFNKQQLEYDKLVDLKKDFLPEMRRTAGEIE